MEDDNMKVLSIAVPSYNSEAYMKKTIDHLVLSLSLMMAPKTTRWRSPKNMRADSRVL